MSVRYKPDFAGTRKLMKGPEMQAMVRSAAEKGKAFAESIAPVGDDATAGEYKASFSVDVSAHGGSGVGGDRAVAHLVNNSDHAAYVEWQDNYHTLAKTADYISRTGP